MKKIFLFCVMMLTVLSLSACKEKKQADEQKGQIVVENVISTDREAMFLNYGDDYRWYETCILLKNFLDEENEGEVAGVSSVFQIVREKDNGADTKVILISHTENADQTDVVDGFWVGDFPLNAEAVLIPFEKAFELVQQANLPKPHSKQCVLRREVGPTPNVNPQYIFGNVRGQVYVDAVTGGVTDTNPAFPSFNGPLGEWP